MFKDQIYEGMDDVERIFEPFNYKLNDELAEFPDRIEVKAESVFAKNNYWGGYSLDKTDLIVEEAQKRNLTKILSKAREINDFFEFQVEDLNDDEQVKFDVQTNEFSHKIFLVKTKIAYDEKELENMRKQILYSTIRYNLWSNREINKPRLNEIADIYNAHGVRSDRSYRGKISAFLDHMQNMIDEKILDIRDMELCQKFANWIVAYVRDGNLAALNNLTRIKIITHEKRPIYSIEEKEV